MSEGVPKPKVFVVTPSLNMARFLPATIESVLVQDYPNLDYFVSDGGSTDGTREILEGYGDRVRWVSQPDGGHAASVHAAWRDTDADIVAWLNSDDTYLDGAVSRAVDHLLAHSAADMVYGEGWYIDAEGRQLKPYPTKKPFDRRALEGECFICQPATFLRRRVFETIDLPDPKLRFTVDYDLWIRLSEHFRIDHIDAFLATYRMHPDNKTLGQRDGLYREIHETARRHFGYVHRNWVRGYRYFRLRRLVRRLFPGVKSEFDGSEYGA